MDDPAPFVIQYHQREPDPHFDIMLLRGDTLRTFSTVTFPGEGVREVRSLPDHRREYLTYEGEISGGRGTVRIRDRGTFRAEEWSPDRISVRLDGGRLQGRMLLTRIEGERWQMKWEASDQDLRRP